MFRPRTLKLAMNWAGSMLILLLFALSIPFSQAWSIDYPIPIASLPSLWTNNNATIPYNATYASGLTIRAILVRQNPVGYGPSFACGFICTAPCDTFLFAVFSVSMGYTSGAAINASAPPRVVWAANRHRPVKENASVQITRDGNLVLRDFDGSLVWSTNTSGSPVVGMNLAQTGNLILFDVVGTTVWESFEHPTDTLLIGQSLRQGKRLTSASANWTQGQFYLTVLDHGLYAFVNGDPPQFYYQKRFNVTDAMVQSKMNISSAEVKNGTAYISFLQGSLSAFGSLNKTDIKLLDISLPWPSSAQLISLEDDGHLRVYGWDGISWEPLADVLDVHPDGCAYPTACGEYGICSQGQCSCPTRSSGDAPFRQLDVRQPNMGCSLAIPLSCDLIQHQQLLPLTDVTYFSFANSWATHEESCKKACLKACTCKAAFFRYQNDSYGSCYLMPKILSLMSYKPCWCSCSSCSHRPTDSHHQENNIKADARGRSIQRNSRDANTVHLQTVQICNGSFESRLCVPVRERVAPSESSSQARSRAGGFHDEQLRGGASRSWTAHGWTLPSAALLGWCGRG